MPSLSQVVSTFPSGFWPEFIEDDSTITNLVDSTFEDDLTSTTALSLDTARDDSDSTLDGNLEGETADEATTAATAETTLTAQYSRSTAAAVSLDAARDDESDSTVDENLVEETVDEATTTVATAETTLAGQDSSFTTDNSATKWSTTTVNADVTTESQNSTLPPPTKQPLPPKQPPSDKPKKNWADIFCDKVKQFFNFMGHKITDAVTFIQRLFH